MNTSKQCSKCKQFFPATPLFFDRCTQQKSGLYPSCKQCEKAYYQSRKELIREQNKLRKEQRNEYMRQYRQTEKNTAYRKAYYERVYPERREERIEQNKRFHALHKEHRNAQKRQRRKSNPELFAKIDKAHKSKRRAQKLASGGSHTAQDIQDQYTRQKGKCYWCKAKLEQYHVDHVVPLNRGGSNDPSNIVIACPACNMHKHDKLPHEWIDGGRLL